MKASQTLLFDLSFNGKASAHPVQWSINVNTYLFPAGDSANGPIVKYSRPMLPETNTCKTLRASENALWARLRQLM